MSSKTIIIVGLLLKHLPLKFFRLKTDQALLSIRLHQPKSTLVPILNLQELFCGIRIKILQIGGLSDAS